MFYNASVTFYICTKCVTSEPRFVKSIKNIGSEAINCKVKYLYFNKI